MLYSFLYFTILCLLFSCTYYLLEKYKKFFNLVFFYFPVILTIILIIDTDISYWLIIKLYFVLFGVWVVEIYRRKIFKRDNKLKYLIYIVFFLNILMAVMKDFSAEAYINFFNGVLVLFLIPSFKEITTDKMSKSNMNWNMPISFIFGYTIWNLLFVYMSFTERIINHLALLAVPLIWGYFTSYKRWIQIRVFILAFYLLVSFVINDVLDLPILAVENTFQEREYFVVAVGLAIFLSYFSFKYFQKDF